MNRRRYNSKYNSTPVWVHTALVVLIIFFLFIAAVTIFRSRGGLREEVQLQTSDDIVEELTLETSQDISVSTSETPRGIPQSAQLADLSGGIASAITKRVFENGFFTHTILANDLQLIDESKFHYQAWLMRPYPFDFFATTKLVHNVDGSWGMIWVGEPGETYDDFVEVLITLEPSDDFDENPSANQILKGSF